MSDQQTIENYHAVIEAIGKAGAPHFKAGQTAHLVAVSKTYDADHIRPVLEAGHRIFGENRVQEAQGKWPALRDEFTDIDLHLIGPLQSNKAADAVALFDCIQTIDREKIAKAIAAEMAKQEKTCRLFVQVNTGSEPQKAGIDPQETVDFVAHCREVHGLAIDGLMCIPPNGENPGPHFALLAKLRDQAGVEKLSMGMSGDFQIAVQFGADYVRVGSAIFGARETA